MKFVIGSVATLAGVLFMCSMASANPALLPKHEGYPMKNDGSPVTGSDGVGGDALPPERFDALVTAAGEKVASVPREDLWCVLARVARESLHSGWCYKTSLIELPKGQEALRDLIDRQILAVEGERVSIRVGLFSAWLRANQ